jgi:peptidoglycan/xylan/chitin deacetylase (PgdA/CDA1 family)
MKRFFFGSVILLLLGSVYAFPSDPQSWIRVNQLGYLPRSLKTAVFVSRDIPVITSFELHDALTGEVVYTSSRVKSCSQYGPFRNSYRLDFSDFRKKGAFSIRAGDTWSPYFRISEDVYDGAADFLLRYMRQQRCGYNPCLKDSCHTHDGYIIYHPALDSTHIDVTGGWHDASDYLQYVATSANAVYQMLFAYERNPGAFGDAYDRNGNPGANGIPDVLDEARWGLDWLVKMNPEKGMMFNQIADDRDHVGLRLPTVDTADYGRGKERPVYFCTGKPQGLFLYKNRTTGIASTAGKFASAFALGAKVLREHYPDFAVTLERKAMEAYDFGVRNPGVCQTAPGLAPYFYEEDNWVDDMELAAWEVYTLSGKDDRRRDAETYGRRERTTPWMGADSARHYQWYPFVNLGHARQAASGSREFASLLKEGLEKVYRRGKDTPFLLGVPFIWCSNNLVAALLTQCRCYEEATGDTAFEEMEAALRDWLFGCNPWGTSMVIGLPEQGDYPRDPHSSLSVKYGYRLDGGLVDGPVYGSVFRNLKGLALQHEDAYAPFQSDLAVYHDDYGDYSTNEPTMDGTATLIPYLSALQKMGAEQRERGNFVYSYGGIVRTDTSKKEINLVFTADSFVDGYETIRPVLKKHGVKAGFFFTGNFYRNPDFARMVTAFREDGHYLGGHSDHHLLYAPWENRDSTLVTKEQFLTDLRGNYAEMAKHGIRREDAPYYMPPYEWYNNTVSAWCREYGITLVNFSPGTSSNQDWTVPIPGAMYYSSDELYNRILDYESNNVMNLYGERERNGLNGFILLIHFGTDPRRTDKLYNKLDALIIELKKRGYVFTSLTETIK